MAHNIHGDPGWIEFGGYSVLFLPAWWAWISIGSVINLLSDLTSRVLGLSMVVAMAAAGPMAARAPQTIAGTTCRPWMYNGGTALLWFIAVFTPLHAAIIPWAVAVAVELAQDWRPGPARASGPGFLIVVLLGWAFFQYGMEILAMGLGQLRSREDFSGLLRTTLFMPFALVLGAASIAAAIATAIPAPNTLLPPGAAVAPGRRAGLFCTAPMRSSRCASARRPPPCLPWPWPCCCFSQFKRKPRHDGGPARPSLSRGKRRPRPQLSGKVRCPGGPAWRSSAGC